jgi:hypothetical protein
MILERGDMWSIFGKTGAFVITTNPIARSDGAIVMGRGIALQAKERFYQLPYDFGTRLHHRRERGYQRYFGLIGVYEEQPVYFFMVKDHWREPADLAIIKHSVFVLQKFTEVHPDVRVDLNFPGIGNGHLPREDVLPLLTDLPDNVHIWEYK